MQNTEYHIWQDENGWRGYLGGYPAYEVNGESFEELQVKLWQLRQDLIVDERDVFHASVHDQPESSEDAEPPATMSRQMSPEQLKTRARVELLMLMMITSLTNSA